MNPSPSAARRAAVLGLCMALAIVVSTLEGWLPSLPVPGAKPGLSNIVTMYALSALGLPAALSVTVGKAVFALLLRGGTAFLMSLAGGLLSTLLMALCLRLLGNRVSYIGVGVAGAVAHNMGQLGMSMLLLDTSLFYYAPWLLLMAAAAGTVTGLALNLVMPALRWGMARALPDTGSPHGNL